VDGQIGLEETPEEYVQKLVAVFREVKRVLKDDGTLWLNIADSYWGSGSRGYDFTGKLTEASEVQAGSKGTLNLQNVPKLAGNDNESGLKNKDLIGIPWMLAFALREDGWYLRQDIIWHKPNPMPESVRDRCTKSHEYIFLLSKSRKYYYDYKAIQEPTTTYDSNIRNRDIGKMNNTPGRSHMNGLKHNMYKVRNKRDVWSVPVRPFKGAHFATFPEELIKPCVLAGSRENGIVLDPFFGSGTTGIVATRFNRDFIGIELNSDYIGIAKRRLESVQTELVFT
jgi:DNA modification methylase